MTGARKTPAELRSERRRRAHSCWGHLIAAPLWVAYTANLGTLLRTCDAVGACMAVPNTPHHREALRRGNTLPVRSCIHWVHSPRGWLARERTIVVLGHEHHGIPDDAWDLLDTIVEIPMVGVGSSLNVAVAGSLVLYRLAGLV